MIVSILAIILASYLIEYFLFENRLDFSRKSNRGISIIKNSDIELDGFVVDEKSNFVSQVEDANLIIEIQNKYVDNLEFKLPVNPNFQIFISYIDPKTGQDVVVKKNVQHRMQKMKFDFLDYQVFNIRNNPKKIILHASIPQTTISQIKIDNSYQFNSYRFLFVLTVLSLLFIFVVSRKKIGEKPEYVFFAIAIICGTLIVVAEPQSYVSWDDRIHYQIADKKSLKKVVKKTDYDVYSVTNAVPSSYSIKEQSEIDKNIDDMPGKPARNSKKDKFNFSVIDFYNKIGHIPSAIGLMLGRLFGLPYHIIFMLGRWANVLLYSAVIFFAIRKLKTGKMIMTVIALFPTAIFLSSNYNYDSWVIAFTMLGLAHVFTGLQQPEKKMTIREMVIMIGSFVIGLGPKAIYFPIMFLLFLMPKSKFDSIKQYKKFIYASAFSLFFVLGSFLIPFLIAGPGNGDKRGGEGVNSSAQVEFILSSPVVYAKILYNFIKNYINPMNAEGFITLFAYLGNINGFMIILTTLAIVVFTDKNEYDIQTSTTKIRLFIVGIYFTTIALIATALYIAFTSVGDNIIAGVQHRYLIPLIFPLLFIIGNNRVKNPINRNIYNLIIFIIMTLVLLRGIWKVLIFPYY